MPNDTFLLLLYFISISWTLRYFCLHSFLKGKSESHSVVSDSLWPHGLYSPWNSPGQNTGVGSLSLLQWIFPTQESNWGLLHCRQILYQLIYEGSPYFQPNSYYKCYLYYLYTHISKHNFTPRELIQVGMKQCICVKRQESERVSHSGVSDSLWPHGL